MRLLNCTPRVIYRHRGGIGEAPIWWAERHRLLQKARNRVVSINLSSGEADTLTLEREPGTLALTEDNRILAACVDRVYVLTDDGQMTPMHQPTRLLAKQFNDGKVGPDGKFYVGTIYGDEAGGLYCLDNAGRLSLLYAGLSI